MTALAINMADDERHFHHHQQSVYHPQVSSSPPMQWGPTPHIYPHSHHGTPAQEYSGFNFGTHQVAMEPSAFGGTMQQRSMAPQLQPLVMPQWPSMLSSQSHSNFQPVYPQPVQPIQPMSFGALQTPVSATSTRSASTPRKTLTDVDRKRMCQYAEDHPNSKQTEIGAIFGVERSTVSKVLRNKEKYLLQDEGNRSPIKRAKGRSPDIERALAVWAKNQEKKGLPLTNELIREKARAFSATTTTPENQTVLSSSWIEKFKLKNNLMGARSRKSSLAASEDNLEGLSTVASSAHTPSGTSPVSPRGIPSPKLRSAQSTESLTNESPSDGFLDFGGRHAAYHSQSTTSLNSAFTDTAPSSFSPGPLSPTSPFFTPDSGTAPSPFVPPLTARPILPATTAGSGPGVGANSQRPRSQTFPLLDQYMAGTSTADMPTPKYVTSTALDSPMEDPHGVEDPLLSIDSAIHSSQPEDRPHTVTPADTMRPPPLPAHIMEAKREPPVPATSPEEAQQALEVVMSFIEQQGRGFLSFQEGIQVGKLMEKLKLQQSTTTTVGGNASRSGS